MTETAIKSEPRLKFKFDNYIKPIIPYISGNHLDIGCGYGEITSYLSLLNRNSRVVGFDIDNQKIAVAKLFTRQNLKFTDSRKDLDKEFSSASGIFVFHEAFETLFLTASKALISHQSMFSIVDYHIKGLNQDDFVKIFSSPYETKELAELGIEAAFCLHTRYNLSDCINLSRKYGFKTISSQIIDNKYFIWTGQN